MYHLGIVDDQGGRRRRLALSLEHDNKEGGPDAQIILLSEDDVDELIKALRYGAKSL